MIKNCYFHKITYMKTIPNVYRGNPKHMHALIPPPLDDEVEVDDVAGGVCDGGMTSEIINRII